MPSRLWLLLVTALLCAAGVVVPANAQTTIPRVGGSPTDGIQEALGSGGEFRLPPGETYVLDQAVIVPRGVTRIDGTGANIIVRSGAEAAIVFVSSAENLVLSNLSIDLSRAPKAKGIVGSAMANREITHPNEVMRGVRIESSTLVGLGPTAKGIEIVAREGHAERLTIADNVIVFADAASSSATKGGVGISVATTAPNSMQGQWSSFTQTNRITAGRYHAKGFVISGNWIRGGYYGLGFEGMTSSEVTGNRLAWNTRNISLQAGSSDNRVTGNYVTDSTSAAIHIAYQSHRNVVQGNIIATTRAKGEGLLQAYTGSQHNQFLSNQVYGLNPEVSQAPMWALYVASGASGTTFDGNLVSAEVSRSMMAAESIWDGESAVSGTGRSASSYSYMTDVSIPLPHGGGKDSYHGGKGDLTGVSFTGNVLHQLTERPALYLGAEVTRRYGAAVGNIRGFTVSGNAVLGNTELVTHEGQLPGVGQAKVSLSGVSLSAAAVPFARSPEVFSPLDHVLTPTTTQLWLLGDAAVGTGNSAANQLHGNTVANTLIGQGGDDTLVGGLGADRLIGGPGADRYVLDSTGQPDQVEFTAADKIVLPRVHFGPLVGAWFTPQGARRGPESRIHQYGSKLYFDPDGVGSLLQPIHIASLPEGVALRASDFEVR